MKIVILFMSKYFKIFDKKKLNTISNNNEEYSN